MYNEWIIYKFTTKANIHIQFANTMFAKMCWIIIMSAVNINSEHNFYLSKQHTIFSSLLVFTQQWYLLMTLRFLHLLACENGNPFSWIELNGTREIWNVITWIANNCMYTFQKITFVYEYIFDTYGFLKCHFHTIQNCLFFYIFFSI